MQAQLTSGEILTAPTMARKGVLIWRATQGQGDRAGDLESSQNSGELASSDRSFARNGLPGDILLKSRRGSEALLAHGGRHEEKRIYAVKERLQ